jgi:hypothetical protein
LETESATKEQDLYGFYKKGILTKDNYSGTKAFNGFAETTKINRLCIKTW